MLADVDAHIAQARSFAGGTRGAPPAVGGVKRPGRPFIRAATVLLAGAMEVYFEAVVEETAKMQGLTAAQLKELETQVRASHGANVHHVHRLTAQIGLPFVIDTIGWSGLPRGGGRKLLSDLAARRNRIAHGNAPEEARVQDVFRWRNLAARLADELDKKCAIAVKEKTGTAPW